ncbi:MBL fold metallo-hydrolase [Streptomyces sp. NPDC002754]
MALPFPSPLGYSFSYLLRYETGFVAVDLGWDTDEGWELFCAALTRAGGSLDELAGVVVTHAHPDHYGLAERVHRHTGAWIGMHPAEQVQIARTEKARRRRVIDIESWLRRCDVPRGRQDEMLSDREQLMGDLPSAWPDVPLLDGAAVPGTGGHLKAIHTPGHTPGHLVFHDGERNMLFTGDHVLPRVTPNVSWRPNSAPDPLEDYRRSVARLTPYGDALALPGHEWSFDRLGSRLEELDAHHEERLDEIETLVGLGHRTVWSVARAASWARPFDSLAPRAVRSALGETHAHLTRLSNVGRLVLEEGEPPVWRAAAA